MKFLVPLHHESFEEIPPRDGFGQGLLELGKTNPDVVALCGDLVESIRVQAFAEAYPDRYIEMGVAEQNMAGVAAGLALSGKVPFISSYAVFSPGRNWDQIRVAICYSKANVKIVGAHAGISVGPDGATHQALEDVAITRVLPNMTVVVPTDSVEARKATFLQFNVVAVALAAAHIFYFFNVRFQRARNGLGKRINRAFALNQLRHDKFNISPVPKRR